MAPPPGQVWGWPPRPPPLAISSAAISALWRENFSGSDLPSPHVFTLEDRSNFSLESGIPDYPLSPEVKLDPRTPIQSEFWSRFLDFRDRQIRDKYFLCQDGCITKPTGFGGFELVVAYNTCKEWQWARWERKEFSCWGCGPACCFDHTSAPKGSCKTRDTEELLAHREPQMGYCLWVLSYYFFCLLWLYLFIVWL